jgi:hypothetical protein
MLVEEFLPLRMSDRMRALYVPDVALREPNEDLLELATFVANVRAAIGSCDAPYVFGIFGEWGIGKTSAMSLLSTSLENEFVGNVAYDIPIWINAWKYENEVNMIYPILFAIKKDYERRLPAGAGARELGRELTKVVGSSLLALSDLGLRAITKKLTGEAMSLKNIGEQLDVLKEDMDDAEHALETWAEEVSRLPDLYERLIRKYAGELAAVKGIDENRIRFIFLIDDLDRCLPDTTVGLLERIKNLLGARNCIYVLGINNAIVQQAIRSKYPFVEVDGREYLEKIINHSFHVPEPSARSIAAFATIQLNKLLPDKNDRDRFQIFLKGFGEVLAKTGFTNPRKIKRLLNRYIAFIDRHSQSGEWNMGNVVRLLILAEYFPQVFRVIWSDPGNSKQVLLALADGTSDFTSFEARYGIALGLTRERIAGIRPLFDLESQFTPGAPGMKEHIEAVASFTRVR